MANTKTIAKAATLVMAFFAVSRVLGVARDVVIAGQFGTSPDYDAYIAAFRLPDFLFYVISGGALGSAFIPVFTGYLTREDETGAWRLASAIINWLMVILISSSALAALFAPQLVSAIIAPGFDNPQQIMLTANLMRLLLISTVIFGVSGLFMGILHAHQHFLLPALAPVIYNLSIIAGAWFLGPIWGVYGLTAGVIVGAVGHLLVQVPGLKHFGMRYRFTFTPGDPGVREVGRLIAPRMLGLAAIQFNFVWDTILASGLSSGSLSGLDYGRRLMLLPQGIIAQAVASAAFPTFSALAARQAWDELQAALIATLRSVLYLTVPASIGLILLGRPIVQVLFERNAFDEASTQATVWALWFYTLGLAAHSIVEIITRAYYALRNTKTPVFVGIISMAVNMLLSLLLMNTFMSFQLAPHGGIALASSAAVIFEMVWLLIALKRLPGNLSLAALAAPSKRIVVAGALMALILWAFLQFFGNAPPWFTAIAGVVLGGLVYGLSTLALGVEEPHIIMRQVKKRWCPSNTWIDIK